MGVGGALEFQEHTKANAKRPSASIEYNHIYVDFIGLIIMHV